MYKVIPVLLLVLFSIPTITAIAFAQDATPVGEGFWSFLESSAPVWVVMGLVALRQISEIIAKTIPDTETSPGLVTIRKIFKILSLYIPNKK